MKKVRSIFKIAQMTFLEICADRVLYSLLVVSFFLLSIALLASMLSWMNPLRALFHFGSLGVQVSCYLQAILLGSFLLSKEKERKTFDLIISRPVSPGMFLTGKLFGLGGILLVNFVGLWIIILGLSFLYCYSQEPHFYASQTVHAWWILSFLETLAVAILACFFSTWSSPALSIIFSLGLYLLGVNLSQVIWIAEKAEHPFIKYFFRFIALILPDWSKFHLDFDLIYELPLSFNQFSQGMVYGVVLISFLLFASVEVLKNKKS